MVLAIQKRRFNIKKLIEEKNWNFRESYAYGDHFSDISLLKTVGYPAVLNPK